MKILRNKKQGIIANIYFYFFLQLKINFSHFFIICKSIYLNIYSFIKSWFFGMQQFSLNAVNREAYIILAWEPSVAQDTLMVTLFVYPHSVDLTGKLNFSYKIRPIQLRILKPS